MWLISLSHSSEKVLHHSVSCYWQHDVCGPSGTFLLWLTVQLHLPGGLRPDWGQHTHLPCLWTVEQTYTYMHRWGMEMSGLLENAHIPHCSDETVSFSSVVQCRSLEVPTHAFMQCQDPQGVNSFGSICTIQCDRGFNLIGTNMTKCLSQGDWSHVLPVCQGRTTVDQEIWDTIYNILFWLLPFSLFFIFCMCHMCVIDLSLLSSSEEV